MLAVGLSAKPCSCMDVFFCETFDPDSNLVLYGHKLANIDTSGVLFEVWDNWGATTTDTVYVWDDSLFLSALPSPWVCFNNIKTWFEVGDTVLLIVKPNYMGSGYGTLNDYVFYHDPCGKHLLMVNDGAIADMKSGFDGAPNTYVVEQSIADYKDRLTNAQGCSPTRIISGLGDGGPVWSPSLKIVNKQLIVSDLQQTAPVSINLYAITGQLVYSSSGETTMHHDLATLSPALYIAEVVQGKQVHRQKLVVH